MHGNLNNTTAANSSKEENHERFTNVTNIPRIRHNKGQMFALGLVFHVRVHYKATAFIVLQLQADAVVKANSGDNVVRKRREWIIPARTLMENFDYTKEEFVAKVSH